jgi:transposase
MRGEDERSGSLFSYVDLEARVGQNHPLRAIRAIVNDALAALTGELSALYSCMGRPSIPPEKLLRAMLLQAFYSIRSERQLMERLEFDLLFRWFVGVGVDDAAWDHSVFSKNRERLLEGEIAAKLLNAVLAQPR